jgi:hypothetical protein
MHPTIGEFIARDRTTTLIREADFERLAILARSEVASRPGASRPEAIRRQVRDLLRLGSRRPAAP